MVSYLRRVLIIDDDADFLVGMKMQLRGSYAVRTAGSVAEGLTLLENDDADLILLDVSLDGENGLDGIKKIHAVHPSVGIAMLSGQRDVKTVVEAIRAGAVEYLTKPIQMDLLAEVVEKASASRLVQERCEALMQSQPGWKNGNGKIIYKSDIMGKLIEETEKIKGHDANVLIIGETGTGKEVMARHIYEGEGNTRRPFIAVNCAAIPEYLLESELFGHEAGAFTGANRRRIGKFELADGGDIFLDEISTMKLDLQVKLLRVLQEREFCRLGSNAPVKANFRVISASNKPLDGLVENGSFRMDLYHRLKVMQFIVPPLRDRTEDIPFLVEHFLGKFAVGGQRKRITERVLTRLMDYKWPGNVRELANVVQSLAIMAQGETIDESIFPPWVLNGCQPNGKVKLDEGAKVPIPSTEDSVSSLKDFVQKAEKVYIEQALEQHKGDKTKTATALEIGRTTLYMKMKELGMEL